MNGFDYAQQERRIASLESNRGASLRFGTVTGVDTATGTARVQLPDGDGMVTMPLRVLERRTLKDKAQALPDIGEPVACLFSGQGLEQGVILGAHYTTNTPSPNQEAQVDYVRYEDGTELWYDRKGHKLTAKVMGDADIETEGGITATAKKAIVTESKTGITLRAPHIRLEGNLSQQGYAGGAASSILCGNQTICNGSLSVPGGDVSAGDVSLRGHQHEGVESGPDTSGKPEGGGSSGTTDDNGSGFWELMFDIVQNSLPEPLTPMEKLLLCLPEIAEAEAKDCWTEDNKKGWLYLRDMFHKWFGGRANAHAETNPEAFFVNMDWILSYTRAYLQYQNFAQADSLFTPNSRQRLAELLLRDGYLSDSVCSFDYTRPSLTPLEGERPWREWKENYFQYTIVLAALTSPPDGLTACMGDFNFRALAAGYTEPLPNGGHRITIKHVSIFVWDSFNFSDAEDNLHYWSCEDKSFSLFPLPQYTHLHDKDFQEFRKNRNMGNDFMVLAGPKDVDGIWSIQYDTEL
ncbi:phage baseplate assembly protein V [Bilophila wadsworthia]|uniref:phage baseplate assembly protein V n=1 Tax=Bilophila wadsworthia TaxID=35833 RepID=UPI002675F7A3|nr:phage baseplate assembly protein V [Bilophila wadsworthia]